MINLQNPDKFVTRHIGPDEKELREMLEIVGASSLDDLINQIIPQQIRNESELKLDEPQSEYDFLQNLKNIASGNKVIHSIIVGALLMVSGIANMIMLPHPLWMWIFGLMIFIPFAYLGNRFLNKNKIPE